jgi:hypothetical protein
MHINLKGTNYKIFNCPMEKKQITFKTHKDLDEYCNKAFDKLNINIYKKKYFEDFLLLKAFDRAFWMIVKTIFK